jgi:cytochrome b561
MNTTTDRPSALSDPAAADRRYSRAAMALHWAIAALIVVQLLLGWYMNDVVPDHSPAQDRVQVVHVSLGLTTLLLVLIRIGIRLTHRPPAMPPGLAAWERTLAHATHILLYLLMLAIPLTGWALLTARHEPIQFWGVDWFNLPGVPEHSRPVSSTLKALHIGLLKWTVLATLLLHVAGAVKHQFDGHPVLWRMLPFGRPPKG